MKPTTVERARPPSAVAREADVVIVGAGAVGLSLGMALAQAGVTVVLVGAVDTRPTGRTVALLEGSVDFLARLGVWRQLRVFAEPLRVMRLVDDTGSLFRGPPLDFDAREIGRPCFGFNIQNHLLVESLAAAAREVAGLAVWPGRLDRFVFGATGVMASGVGEGGIALTGASGGVLVAADGRRSAAREAAGIPVRETSYAQEALTATLHHDRPHRNVSTEFHTRQGPFTLVPLPGMPDEPHRSSLVWGMAPETAERRGAYPPERLARDIERQSRMLLGRIRVVGPVGRFPIASLRAERLVGPRIALAGEAAHAMAPIGAQGLNLSLRDAAALAEVLADAKRGGEDLGNPAVLDRYARARQGDVASRSLGVDWLNRAILDDRLPTDLLRATGLLAMGTIGPLRRFAMRRGLMPGTERGDAATG